MLALPRDVRNKIRWRQELSKATALHIATLVDGIANILKNNNPI